MTNDWDALLLRSEELVKQVRRRNGGALERAATFACPLRRWNHQ